MRVSTSVLIRPADADLSSVCERLAVDAISVMRREYGGCGHPCVDSVAPVSDTLARIYITADPVDDMAEDPVGRLAWLIADAANSIR